MAASMPVAMLYAYLEFHRKTDWSNPCMAYSPDPMQNNDAQSIKVLRAKAGLAQEKFAALIQVDLSTLRNWEQGRREPTGPAKALIHAITNDPKHVLRALEVRESMRKAG